MPSIHTSTLNLYKDVSLEIDRNLMIDNMTAFLSFFSKSTISNFQYIKHELTLNIKVDLGQVNLDYNSAYNYNYCSIQNDDGKIVYYYIVGKEWRGQSTILLHLQMDTINTFTYGTDYVLSNKSLVLREHKDRFQASPRQVEYYHQTTIEFNTSPYTYVDQVDLRSILPTGSEIDSVSIESSEFFPEKILMTSSINITQDEEFEATLNFASVDPIDTAMAVITYKVLYTQPYVRKIDKFPESINPLLYKKDIMDLIDADGYENWYVIYKNANAVVSNPSDTEVKAVNPVKILLCRDTPFTKSAGSLATIRLYCKSIPKYPNVEEVVIFSYYQLTSAQIGLGNTTITINGTTWTLVDESNADIPNHKATYILWTRVNNNDTTGKIRIYKSQFGSPSLTINNVEYIDVYNYTTAIIYPVNGFLYKMLYAELQYKKVEMWNIASGANSDVSTSKTIADVDLTDSQIIKIISLPYAPFPELVGIDNISVLPEYLAWNTTDNMLELRTTNIFQFHYSKQFDNFNPLSPITYAPVVGEHKPRNDLAESKMYASEFYYQKFVYLGTSYQFNLEFVDVNSDIYTFIIDYAVSQSLMSKMLFKFVSYITTDYDLSDYNDVLFVGTNTEKPLYNNAYVNYMREGYEYDNQTKNNERVMNAFSVAMKAIGTASSFALAPLTGGLSATAGIALGTSFAQSVVSAVHSANQAERNLSQKRENLARQTESVSAVEDLDLIEVYSSNKPKIVEYKPSAIMKKRILDLFHYCGYATQEYKAPSFTGRRNFNFVQALIKYKSDSNLPEAIKDDIRMKFELGITKIHKNANVGATIAQWDIEEEYENYETILFS